MKTCMIIPVYNHGSTIESLLENVSPYKLPCILIDDGSDEKTKAQLKIASKKFDFILLTLPHNGGKGAAVLAGIHYAKQHEFTHALQIDADGQHNTNDISKFLDESLENPEALIAGAPLYDHTVPKSRLYGRRITNFWVSIETMSRQIKDAMCGFRIYPVDAVEKLTQKVVLSSRMGFDIDIIVRLMWQDVHVKFIPTKVIYPKDGISHFKIFKDNLRISGTHTKLFFGMLKRSPFLMARKFQSKSKNNSHWASITEVGVLAGLKFTLWCYRAFGKVFTYFLLYFLSAYFYITKSKARLASKQYLENLQEYAKTPRYSCYQHFLSYAQSIVDKLAVWRGDIVLKNLDIEGSDLLIPKHRGSVILTSHLGNIEIARALSHAIGNAMIIHVLVFQKNSAKINQILNEVNPKFAINLIEVETVTVSLMIALQDKIEAGEFIVIAADRTSITKPDHSISANFLGKAAYFPKGAFLLAGLLACRVLFMVCVKSDANRYRLVIQEFSEKFDIARSNRVNNLRQYAQQYADLLSAFCVQYPLQWFNFFNFWQQVK